MTPTMNVIKNKANEIDYAADYVTERSDDLQDIVPGLAEIDYVNKDVINGDGDTSVNSIYIRENYDIIHGHTPREGISRPIYL